MLVDVKIHAPPTASDFQIILQEIFDRSEREGMRHVDIISGDLHRRIGGYPGPNHRMPVCCSVMRKMMKRDDKILSEPPKGQGATLKIRYYFPRNMRKSV